MTEKSLNQMFSEANQRINDFIDMLYIQGISKGEESNKTIDENVIDGYLKRRGYAMNYVLGQKLATKEFTVVYNGGNYIEIWHDLPGKQGKSVFVKDSLLTGLPITLNYMERI
jgi:hypothetical protein